MPGALSPPRLLFVRQRRIRPGVPFMAEQGDELEQTLALHFALTVQQEDFDLAQVCDRVAPDMILLESPGELRPVPLAVSNLASHRHLPRLAIHRMDPHDTARPCFFRLLDDWQIERVFVMGNAPEVHSPELVGRTYSISHFYDAAVFRDYGEAKIIPVSIFGGRHLPAYYNWRAETAATIASFFPTLLYTHPGYAQNPRHRFPIWGEAYARMLNRSWFSLADTTRLGEPVRKHLEIPAAGAVLVAPDGAAIRDYGFRDMENAILGSGQALFDKIATAITDEPLYRRLQQAGQALVQGRYARERWTGPLDWYRCFAACQPGESVVQDGAFGPYRRVAVAEAAPACRRSRSDNDYTLRLKRLAAAIHSGRDLAEAIAGARDVISWLGHIGPEACLLLAIVALLEGNPATARDLIGNAREMRVSREGDSPWDPVEVAWLMLTALLTGEAELAMTMLQQGQTMNHLLLRRMTWLVDGLFAFSQSGGRQALPLPEAALLQARPDDRLSIHWLGQDPLGDWLALMERVLAACGVDAARLFSFAGVPA
jgi:hypothetical protein